MAVAILTALTGCHLVDTAKTAGAGRAPLKPVPAPPGSASLDIAWVIVPEGRTAEVEPLWRLLDEQAAPQPLRRAWNENGLRVGLVGTQLPAVLREWLDGQQRSSAVEGLIEDANEESLTTTVRIRGGGIHPVTCTPTLPEWTLLTRRDGRLTGTRLTQAIGTFVLKVCDAGHQGTKLEVVPEIQHGDVRQRVIGAEGSYRYETVRPKETFSELRLPLTLLPGQTLILGSTADEYGLGERYFRDREGRRRLLLVRLASVGDDVLLTPRPLTP